MRGNGPLEGEVKVQGSKNAALPMMAAAVLHEGRTVLHNCPRIADVFEMEAILRSMGVKTAWSGHTLELDCNKICETGIPGEETRTMRSSILLLGSMLGRCKRIRIGYPGGCTIGARPVDLHLDAMKKMGVLIRETEGEICGECPEGLSGAHIHFPISSVGATENALLAGVTARGETLLENCALEPEIMHLCHFLQAMGAEIRGIGTRKIWMRRAAALRDVEYTIPTDRIVAGTCLYAAAATRGQIGLKDVDPQEMKSVLRVYEKMGGQYEWKSGKLIANGAGIQFSVPFLETEAYPGFPTDLQSPLLAVLATVPGISRIRENIFENRFKICSELTKMGAHIEVRGSEVKICGSRLKGCRLRAEELRGGAALVIAALAADGESVIEGVPFIRRGYEDICRDLRYLQAEVYMEDILSV